MFRDRFYVQHRSGGLLRFSKTLQNIEYESLSYVRTSNYSLTYLCCKVIVSDGQFAKQLLYYLPPSIYKHLMSVAIINGRDRAIQILLTVWPSATLKLSELIPPFHNSIDVIYDRSNRCRWLQDSFFITSSLINGFISCLCKDSKLSLNKLKTLDLTGFPAEDTTIRKIAKIILSSCRNLETSSYPQGRKRAREDDMVFDSSVGCQSLKVELNSTHEEKFDNSDIYTINVDSYIYVKESFEVLSRLFTSKAILHSPLKLHFSNIDLISCYGNKNIMQLLGSAELQSVPLRGLSLSCNRLTNGGIFETLIVSVLPFHYIESLDLSYNSINLTYNATLLETFTNALSSLNHLKRLDLSNNRLTDCLTTILSKVGKMYVQRHSESISSIRSEGKRKIPMSEPSHGLEYLNISSCKLCERDLAYLSNSHHITALKELDIGQNNMCLFVESVVKLLRAMRRTIYILDMEECYFTEEQLCSLLPEFYGFPNLKYLNYSGHQLNSKDTYSHLETFIRLPNLVLVRLSFPTDCCEDVRAYTYNAEININEQGKVFKQKCQSLLASKQTGKQQLNVFWN